MRKLIFTAVAVAGLAAGGVGVRAGQRLRCRPVPGQQPEHPTLPTCANVTPYGPFRHP